MSSSVCRGLQSCLFDQPRVLQLKLAPPRSPLATPAAGVEKVAPAVEWSFSQAFAVSPASHIHSHVNDNTTEEDKKSSNEEVQQVYMHPLAKRSVSLLTARSLEMCTESLGSETGSGVSESKTDSDNHHDHSKGNQVVIGGTPARRLLFPEAGSWMGRNKLARTGSFPPPLMSTGIQVRSRREGGRLVMEAVPVSTCRSFFHVERSQGRLRVGFSEDHWCAYETHHKEEEEEEGEEEEEEEEKEEETVDEYEEGDDEEEENEFIGEDWEGNCGIVGGELGKERLLSSSSLSSSSSMRIRWCKGGESGSGALRNWKPKPCWVAT